MLYNKFICREENMTKGDIRLLLYNSCPKGQRDKTILDN